MHVTEEKTVLVVLPQNIMLVLLRIQIILTEAETVLHVLHFAVAGDEITVSDLCLADEDIFFEFIPILF